MELAPLTPADLKIAAKLVRTGGRDLAFMSEAALKTQTFNDPDRDDAFLLKAVEKKKMIGLGLGVARKSGEVKAGWIKHVGVEARWRRKGVGSLLVAELERRFHKRQILDIRVGACPAPYISGGVRVDDTPMICLLLRRGFDFKDMVRDMTADLRRFKPKFSSDEMSLMKKARIRKAGPKDREALLAMVGQAFPFWVQEARMGLDIGFTFIAEDAGQIVGFGCGDASNPGWFGPTGTLESQRGKGLGKLLLLKSLEEMKRRKHKEARIPWVGPIGFYSRFSGALMGPVYFTMTKKLT